MYSNTIRRSRIGVSNAIKYMAKNEFIPSNEQINNDLIYTFGNVGQMNYLKWTNVGQMFYFAYRFH